MSFKIPQFDFNKHIAQPLSQALKTTIDPQANLNDRVKSAALFAFAGLAFVAAVKMITAAVTVAMNVAALATAAYGIYYLLSIEDSTPQAAH